MVERMAILSPGERLDKEAAPIELRLGRDPEAPNSVEEALERAADGPTNKGYEAATAAMEMATVARALRDGGR
mgnify:FL=1